MKHLLTLIFYTIAISYSAFLNLKAQEISINSLHLDDKTKLESTELVDGYVYTGFDANENYLFWLEMYTQTISIYDLKQHRLQQIVLKNGRGPHEAQRIISLAVVDSTIFISDYYNLKLIRVNIEGTFSKDVVLPKNAKPFRIRSSDKSIYMLDKFNKVAPVVKYELNERQNVYELSVDKDINKDFVTGFQVEGEISAGHNTLVHITKYYPRLYVYDLANKSLLKKIRFDNSEVIEGYRRPHSSGGRVMLPPEKVDILNEDIALVPGTEEKVLILSEGQSNNRAYGLDKLWEYDFTNEKFIKSHDMEVKLKAITANDKYLFGYSEEDNAIYRYKIVRSSHP